MDKKTHLHTITLLLTILIVVGIGIVLFRTYNFSKEALSPKTSERVNH